MRLDEYVQHDGLGLAALVRRREVSPLELLACARAAIEQTNPAINAVVTQCFELAEAEIAGGLSDGPFTGVPFLIKELGLHAANIPLNCGSRLAQGLTLPYDTELMSRFRRAGLVTVGTTSTPEFGFSASTEPILYGPARNPWNLFHSSGGSSGGSAAAVAAGVVPLAHGNDGGGSIRVPASCCGLVGLKPTRDRTPAGPDCGEMLSGMAIEFGLTRSVRDCAALLDAVAGPDPGARGYLPSPARPWRGEVERPPEKLRVAWTAKPASGLTIHCDCRKGVETTAALLASLGHEVVEAAPSFDWESFLCANLAVWTANLTHWIDAIASLAGRKPSEDNLETSVWACYRHGETVLADSLLAALDTFNVVSRAVGRFCTDFDVLLSPTVAQPPPRLGTLDANAPGINAETWTRQVFDYSPFTPIYNVTGQPAISLPLAQSNVGLPIGMQFACRPGDEATLLRLAAQLEQAQPWVDRRSPLARAMQ